MDTDLVPPHPRLQHGNAPAGDAGVRVAVEGRIGRGGDDDNRIVVDATVVCTCLAHCVAVVPTDTDNRQTLDVVPMDDLGDTLLRDLWL